MRTRRPRILVVEDDETVSDIVARYLRRDSFAVEVVGDGQSALERVEANEPDLVVLDLMLPRLNGFDVCQRLRARKLPIVILSARAEEGDRIMGLELGADDYVVKPFSPRELAARVRSVLRRSGLRHAAVPITLAGVDLDPRSRTVEVDGLPVDLTTREFDLLAFLMQNPGRVFTRDELLGHVWGYTFGGTSTVTVHVQRLRRKLDGHGHRPSRITTIWGAGYRFDG